MMNVMRVRVRVGQGLVAVPMRVRHVGELLRRVLVLVVLVMVVHMGVLERLVGVHVVMNVSCEHQCAGTSFPPELGVRSS